jgi:hypothetical protein
VVSGRPTILRSPGVIGQILNIGAHVQDISLERDIDMAKSGAHA